MTVFILLTLSAQLVKTEETKADPKAGISIVDATANNGSFETGDIAPWIPVVFQVSTMSTGGTNASNIVKIVKDPAHQIRHAGYAQGVQVHSPACRICHAPFGGWRHLHWIHRQCSPHPVKINRLAI